MTPTLSSSVEIVRIAPHCLELRDMRTGFRVCLESDRSNPPMVGGELSDEAASLLEPLGFLGEYEIAELRARQRPFRDALQAELRDGALRGLLTRLPGDVSFYRRESGYDFSIVGNTQALVKLPILDKEELRENFDQLLSSSAEIASGLSEGRYAVVRTSGSAAERLQVFADLELDHVPPEYEDVWGVRPGDIPRTAILTSPLCSARECHLGRSTMAERTQFGIVLYLNSTEDIFHAPESLVGNIADELWTFRPHFLLANPCYLLRFAREAGRLGLPLPPVDAILTSYQYASLAQRRALSHIFSAPVFDIYTATELCGCMLGVECRNGNLHVFENQSIVEVEPDQLYGDGIGRLLATTHASRIMPLLRYDVGDLARLVDTDCSCPLSDWQCMELHGRKRDSVRLAGRWFTTKQVDDIVSSVDGIDFYRFETDGGDIAHLDFIPAPDGCPPDGEIVVSLREGFGVRDVSVSRVAGLRPERSMKYPLSGMLRNTVSA